MVIALAMVAEDKNQRLKKDSVKNIMNNHVEVVFIRAIHLNQINL